MSAPLLEVENATVRYGRVTALLDFSMLVDEGEVVGVLGANGAGKSSLLAAIVGQVPLAAGDVRFAGESIVGRRTEDIARMGVALVPEGRHIFATLTVEENLRLGGTVLSDASGLQAAIDEVLTMLPRLRPLLHTPAGRLSGGEQQQLAIARAVLGKPRILILDEPSLGLAPIMMDRVFEILAQLHGTQVTIVLVEQSVSRALALSDRVYVLSAGRCAATADADEPSVRELVSSVYLGTHT